jgi:class 3 adenylate cyclase/tetratricopeptide (TPR) repeat protein
VLFCDLVNSTAIAERMDPEEYRELLDAYLALALTEIQGHGGLVNQLAGDGFMALFGAPVAREDAPEAAVRASLAIHRALERLPETRPSPRLRARIGIHTGPAVVGTVGNDHKMDYTAVGDTTNLAARLQAAAEGGTTLLSEATHRLVRDRFDVEPLGAFEVRGRSEPVRGYRVVAARSTASPMAIAEARGLTPFAGREPELSQLLACFARLGDGLSQLVSVIGEAGSGKSRLVHELKRRLSGRDLALFEGRGSPASQSVALAPFLGLLKSSFGIEPGDDSDVVCEKIATKVRSFDPDLSLMHPPLCALLADRGRGAEDEPLRSRAFAAADLLVEALARTRPVVLILEDLHWADKASLDVLESMAASLERLPVMLLVTYRPEFKPAWRVSIPWTQLHLRRLSDPEIVGIVRGRACCPLPEELEARIVRRAEGNPFYAEEITRALLEDGTLVRRGERLELAGPLERVTIPGTVQEVLEARLDRLPPPEKRTAQVAAVLGRQFQAPDLESLLEPEGIELAGALDSLAGRGVIRGVGPGVFRFGESLTQLVAYESLLLRERRRLHGRIATGIERDPRTLDAERAGLLAHHLARSDQRARGIGSLLALARETEELPSYPTALELYREAWQLGETVLREEEADPEPLERSIIEAALGVARITVLYNVAGGDELVATGRARELAERLGNQNALASALTFEGLLLCSLDGSRFREGIEHIERGVALARAHAKPAAALGTERALGWIYLMDGRFADAEATMERLLRELSSEGLDDPPSGLWLSVRSFRGQLLLFQDRVEEALAYVRENHELSQKGRNRTLQGLSAGWLARMLFMRGEYEPAIGWAERALELGRAIGSSSTTRVGAALVLAVRLQRGEEVSLREMRREIEGALPRGDLDLSSQFLTEVLCEAGMAGVAEALVERVGDSAGGRLQQLLARLARGELALASGASRFRAAEEAFALAGKLASEIGSRTGAMLAELGAARLAHLRGEREVARSKLEWARDQATVLSLYRYRDRASAWLRTRGAAEA